MKTDLTSGTAPSILGLLARRPMTGYELKTAIATSIGNFWSESFGQIYPELRRLEETGFVTSEREESETPKSKRRYTITAAGHAALETWLAQPPRHRPPRNELLLKLFFGPQADVGRLIEYVEELKRQHEGQLLKVTRNKEQLRIDHEHHPGLPFWLMTISNGEFSYRASIEWCDQTLKELEKLRTTSNRP